MSVPSRARTTVVPLAARRRRAARLAWGLVSLAVPGVAAAQPGPAPTLVVTRTAQPPAVDGSADDVAWRAAPAQDDFRTFAPVEGATPTWRTETRLLYDDRALYVLVRAHDPQPAGIVRRLARRDTFDGAADQVLVFLDPLGDHRSGYEFVVTAGGVKSDALLSNDVDEDFSWDGVWDAAVRVDSIGWVAELAIPLRQLRFAERAAPRVGILIGRWIGRTGERMSVPLYRRSRAGLVSQLGPLAGLRDLPRGAALDVTPYVLTRARNLRGAAGARGALASEGTAGGDVKWAPRPGVTVDATVNPDFGQVDADPAVLDLTGGETFQAERRPFFLEGAGQLAQPLGTAGSPQLFYSRRIGRRPALRDRFGDAASPSETSIAVATKLLARFGPATTVAALAARTGEERGPALAEGGRPTVLEPAATHAVARLQRDFRAGRSGVGVMLTHVDREVRDSAVRALVPAAADAVALAAQHQSADGAYQASGWLARSDVRGSTAAIAALQRSPVHAYQRPDDGVAYDPTRTALRGTAAFLSLAKVGGGIVRYGASYRRFAPGFDVNDLGYLRGADAQQASASAGVAVNRPGALVGIGFRSARATLGYEGSWTAHGLSAGRQLTVQGTVQRPDLAQWTLSLTQDLGALCASPTCTRGGPAWRTLAGTTLGADVTGDPRRALVPRLTLGWTRADGGRSRLASASADLTWRARSNLELGLVARVRDERLAWQFYRRFGDAASDTARYTVAGLVHPTRALTGRVNFTPARTLTLQWYGEAFVSRGAYRDVREIAEPRARDAARRFVPWGDPEVASAPGGIDYKQLRSNAVLRWEYRPASALVVVWAQGRDHDGTTPATPGLWPGRDLRDLLALPPRNTLAVKLSYRLAR